MKINELLKQLKNIIHDPKTLADSKLRNNVFTRMRKMSFAFALCFLLDMRKTTLQTRLNLFFSQMQEGEPISQQAFSKLRANFDHSPFETMLHNLVQAEYSGNYELPLWNNYHVLAVDGSYVQLPITPLLALEYGIRGGGYRPSAGVSVLYDVLHGWALDPIITHTDMNERFECNKHIDFLIQQLPHIAENSALLLDRGYPSLDLLEKIQVVGLKYLVRCSSQFVSEVNNAPIGDSVVKLKNGISVRVIKFVLSSGEIEVLATNLFDIPEPEIAQLYTLRWGIESYYFRLKRELCIEKFSGKTPNSIRQDFWVGMVLLNSIAVFQKEADEEVLKRQRESSKTVKHVNRARTSDLIITLRDRFIFVGLCGHPILADVEIKSVIKTLVRSVSPVRPGRSYQRRFAPTQTGDANLKSHL